VKQGQSKRWAEEEAPWTKMAEVTSKCNEYNNLTTSLNTCFYCRGTNNNTVHICILHSKVFYPWIHLPDSTFYNILFQISGYGSNQ